MKKIRFESQAVQVIRQDLGMSQREFAKKLRVSRQSVAQWEDGNCLPGVNSVVDMCNTYCVPINIFFEEV